MDDESLLKLVERVYYLDFALFAIKKNINKHTSLYYYGPILP